MTVTFRRPGPDVCVPQPNHRRWRATCTRRYSVCSSKLSLCNNKSKLPVNPFQTLTAGSLLSRSGSTILSNYSVSRRERSGSYVLAWRIDAKSKNLFIISLQYLDLRWKYLHVIRSKVLLRLCRFVYGFHGNCLWNRLWRRYVRTRKRQYRVISTFGNITSTVNTAGFRWHEAFNIVMFLLFTFIHSKSNQLF